MVTHSHDSHVTGAARQVEQVTVASKAAGVCERRQSQRGRTDKQKEETETNKTRKDQHTFTTLWDNQRKKGIKVEDEKQTQAMEATVDEDDGTFTNISLADDTGNPLLQI